MPQPAPFGRYTNLAMLGSGGMGAVYRALDPALGRHVAIKVLTQRDPKYVERFRREAQVLAKIAHPSIIQIYEIVAGAGDDADPYIVMEYFDGRPLDAVVKDGPLPQAQVMAIVRQCAEGLRKAHANEVIHRDIKPGNLMISAAGEVKILDFGVAKLRDAKSDLTGENVLGTPYYMSPEQATGYGLDARSDIYSLGITAFHLLTGRRPFEAKGKVDVMMMQLKNPLPSVTALVPCDERVARIVEKMCAKKPAERYQGCDDLLAAIAALPPELGGRQHLGEPESTRVLPLLPRTPAVTARRSPPAAAAHTGRGGLWTGIAAGAAAAALVLAALGFFYERNRAAQRGRVPASGWLARGALRRFHTEGRYGNCVFSATEFQRGLEEAAAAKTELAAADPIFARCYFPRPIGETRAGQVWEELWIDGRKRAHVIYDPPLPADDDQVALRLSALHAGRLRELSSGKHILDLWIYRQSGVTETPQPLAAGELVVRK